MRRHLRTNFFGPEICGPDTPCINIFSELQALTIDVIGRCAFGVESDALHNRNDEFYVNSRKFFLEIALDRSWASMLGCKRFVKVIKKCKILVIFPYFGRFFRKHSAIGRAEKILADNLTKVVEERKKSFGTYDKIDLIELLLQQDQIRQKTENVSF